MIAEAEIERVQCTFCFHDTRIPGRRDRYRVDCPECGRNFAPVESVMQATLRAAERAEQVNGRRRTGPPYTVRVFDLYHFMDESEEIDIPGFSTLGQAREYARRRTRDSLEEFRAPGRASEDVRKHWLTFGEDCVVLDDGYRGSEEIDYFAAKPATSEERDWMSISPIPQSE